MATLFATGDVKNNQYDNNLMKHAVYNTIRSYKDKFKYEFGDIVICCDSRNGYWRKEIFEYYKADRKKSRDDSKFDWDAIFKCINEIKVEMRENFPYKLLEVDRAEADDVIAVLAKNIKEPTVIVASDADFIQLLRYPWVKQYSVRAKGYITSKDPEADLRRHIIKAGDDGIPNIKSDSDTFVNPDKRQASIFEKDMVNWIRQEPSEFCTEKMLENYKRNQQLIDFKFIPEDIQANILAAFEEKPLGDKQKLYTYFFKNKMMNLMMDISNF